MGTIKVPVLLVVSLARGSRPTDAHTKAASCLILTYVHLCAFSSHFGLPLRVGRFSFWERCLFQSPGLTHTNGYSSELKKWELKFKNALLELVFQLPFTGTVLKKKKKATH